MSGKPGMRSDKATALSPQYSEGFLDDLDGRCRVARALRARLMELHADLGGTDTLSYAEKSLAKRALHLEARLETVEQQLAKGEDVEIGQYIQGVNSLIGVFKTLGLKRVPRDATLGDLLSKKRQQ